MPGPTFLEAARAPHRYSFTQTSWTGVSRSVCPALSVDTQDSIGEAPGPTLLALRLLEFVLWSVVAKRVIPALRRQKQED